MYWSVRGNPMARLHLAELEIWKWANGVRGGDGLGLDIHVEQVGMFSAVPGLPRSSAIEVVVAFFEHL